MSTRTQATDCNTRESSFSNSSRLTLPQGYALDAHIPAQPCSLGGEMRMRCAVPMQMVPEFGGHFDGLQ
ncbi:ABC multidrug transporter [Aspergillus luchuensis]|uniref:ABC multidrug transporter n=1 Tax=Aspergillus kawachii TaxID=1069201 RepID=A0A146F092_ASPKA|nr:ABC multidrug transporter [Aspergillus luchuensis]